MKIRNYLFLILMASVVLFPVAIFQQSPGYMDADYYYVTGLNLASGYGFNVDFIWNYLSEPRSLPVPSHIYWMPLTSILVFLGKILFGATFLNVQLAFIAISFCLPLITARIAYAFSRNVRNSMFAGLLAVFSGFYLVFLPTTDAFGLYMLLGGFVFLLVMKIESKPQWFDPLLFGILAGLLHMTRADGVLWVFIGSGIFLFRNIQKRRPWTHTGQSLGLLIMGYLLIMSPWYVRNINLFGTLFPPGGSKTLWLTVYDELFAFPASTVNIDHWLTSGLRSIIQTRLWALGQNLQSFVAVQGGIVLLPLILLGGWLHKDKMVVKVAVVYWLSLFLIMSLILPFPGVRGSYFHSGSAVQPLLWALVPTGLEAFVAWGVKKRDWNSSQAKPIFVTGILLILFLISAVLTARSLGFFDGERWGNQIKTYQKIGHLINSIEEDFDSVVMVNNPPGFYLATDLPTIVIPGDSIGSVLAAANMFRADYLILEPDKNFPEIYTGDQTVSWLSRIANIDGMQVYKISRNSK